MQKGPSLSSLSSVLCSILPPQMSTVINNSPLPCAWWQSTGAELYQSTVTEDPPRPSPSSLWLVILSLTGPSVPQLLLLWGKSVPVLTSSSPLQWFSVWLLHISPADISTDTGNMINDFLINVIYGFSCQRFSSGGHWIRMQSISYWSLVLLLKLSCMVVL